MTKRYLESDSLQNHADRGGEARGGRGYKNPCLKFYHVLKTTKRQWFSIYMSSLLLKVKICAHFVGSVIIFDGKGGGKIRG